MEFPQNMMKELFYQTIVDMLDLDPEVGVYLIIFIKRSDVFVI